MRDTRRTRAVLYEILIRACKRIKKGKEYKYEGISDSDFRWILNRVDFMCREKVGVGIYENSVDIHFIFETYYPDLLAEDWEIQYVYNKTGTIKIKNGKPVILKRKLPVNHLYYISQIEKECIKNVVLRWKIYGKFFVKLVNFEYSIKSNLKRIKDECLIGLKRKLKNMIKK